MLSENYTLSKDELFLISNATIERPVDPTLIFGPQRDSLFIVIPITIIYIIIFITGLVGNMFTIIVIIRNKSMHTATNYYLFSLAVSDLLLLVSGMPQEIYSIWSKWPYVFGAGFCLIRGLAAETSTNASILTITLFTIERYLAICHPFLSHKMSKLSRASKHVVLLWLVAFGLALPQALQFGLKSFKGVVMCLQTRVIIEHSFEISTAVFFLVPMLAITVLYSLIGLRLKKTSRGRIHKNVEGVPVGSINKRQSRSTRKVVKMLVAVVVAFFVCWAPFHAQRLVAIYGTAEDHSARSPSLLFIYTVLTYCSGIFYYISTCINPILYHIMCNKFRVAFKKTVVCCFLLERRAALHHVPCSSNLFPTHRDSNFSGNNTSGNRTSFYKKETEKATENYSSQFSKYKPGGSKQEDCGAVFCRHKDKIKHSIRQWESKKHTERQCSSDIMTSQISCTCTSYSKCLYQYERPSDQSFLTNNAENDEKQCESNEMKDELASYLEEINARLSKCK